MFIQPIKRTGFGLTLAMATAFSLLISNANAAPSAAAKTCAAWKSTINSKKKIYLKVRQRTTRFAYSAFYCQSDTRFSWKIVHAKDGKCYLHSCEPYLDYHR